jgi:hypothetical protein
MEFKPKLNKKFYMPIRNGVNNNNTNPFFVFDDESFTIGNEVGQNTFKFEIPCSCCSKDCDYKYLSGINKLEALIKSENKFSNCDFKDNSIVEYKVKSNEHARNTNIDIDDLRLYTSDNNEVICENTNDMMIDNFRNYVINLIESAY